MSNNNQTQQPQPTTAQATSQATQQPAQAPAPLEFIGINTSASTEMFKGGSGAALTTKEQGRD